MERFRTALEGGKCGGCRIDGSCEVFEDRSCIWEIACWRAKNRGEVEGLRYVIPLRNWKLYETSTWYDYFTGRDHAAVKAVLPADPAERVSHHTGGPPGRHA